MTHGVYDADGKIRCTQAPGGTFVGAYAPDGSWYVTIDTDLSPGWHGCRAPDGSLIITDATDSPIIGIYDVNSGAIRVTTSNSLNGALRISGITFGGGTGSTGEPIGLLLALTHTP